MNIFCDLLIRTLLRVVPLKNGRIVCTSFAGHYSDSPKHIARKIKKLKPDAEVIWLVTEKSRNEAENEFETAIIDSFWGRYYSSTAQIRIDNVYGDSSYTLEKDAKVKNMKRRIAGWLKTRKKQRLYTTWHGTPLKCMGRDQLGNDITNFYCNNATMILDNQYTVDIMRHITFDKIKMQLIGLPRNDLMFITEEERCKTKIKLGLPLEKKILLFAPSFRNDGKDTLGKNVHRSGLNQLSEIDFEELFDAMNTKFGDEWVFVCRFHYHVESMVNWEEITEKYNGRIINGNKYEDMAEYLTCSDVLLSDVSSCVFDFSLTYRPCFLYFPDYDHYKNKERGFYYPIERLPFPLSKTFAELIQAIHEFDVPQYQENVASMHKEFGFVDEKNSAETIAEYILRENDLL